MEVLFYCIVPQYLVFQQILLWILTIQLRIKYTTIHHKSVCTILLFNVIIQLSIQKVWVYPV
jgi:hypothetical protein